MQNDLFEIPVSSSNPMAAGGGMERFAFLERCRFTFRLDQILVGMIVMIMLFVFTFSYGVEKGKRFAMVELRAERAKREHMVEQLRGRMVRKNQDRPGIANAVPPTAQVITAAVVTKDASDSIAPTEKTKSTQLAIGQKGKYTIQIVTYKSQSTADRYIKKLTDKGLNGFVIPSGSFLQVCVNAYDSRNIAQQALRKLKSNGIAPPDAYIRMIPR